MAGEETVVYGVSFPVEELTAKLGALKAAIIDATTGIAEASGGVGEAARGATAATTDALKDTEAAAAAAETAANTRFMRVREEVTAAREAVKAMFGAVSATIGKVIELGTTVGGKGARAMRDFSKAQDNAVYSLQVLISESGVITTVMRPFTDLLIELRTYLIENNKEIQALAFQGLASFGQVMQGVTPLVSLLAQGVVGATQGTQLFAQTLVLAGTALVAFSVKGVGVMIKQLATALDATHDFARGLAEMARAAGQDGMADKLDAATRSIGGLAASANGFGEDVDRVASQMIATTAEMAREVEANAASLEKNIVSAGEAVGGAWDKIGKSIEANATKAGANIKDLSKQMSRGRPGAPQYIKEQVEILRLEMAIVSETRAENLALAAQLTHQKALLEAALARKQEANKLLGATQERLAILQSEAELEQTLKDLRATEQESGAQLDTLRLQLQLMDAIEPMERAAIERQIALTEAQHAYNASKRTEQDLLTLTLAQRQAEADFGAKHQADFEERAAQVNAQIGKERADREAAFAEQDAQISAIGEALDGAFGAANADPTLAALAAITGGLDTTILKYRELARAGATSTQALAGAGAGAAGVLGGVFASMTKDTRKAAAIQGAFAAAQAILYAFTPGMQASAIGAGAAAAAHFAVAGMGGGSSQTAGSGESMASAAGTGGGVGMMDTDQAARRSAQYIAEALGGQRGGGNTTINLNLGQATFLEESPTVARRLTAVVMSELDRNGRS